MKKACSKAINMQSIKKKQIIYGVDQYIYIYIIAVLVQVNLQALDYRTIDNTMSVSEAVTEFKKTQCYVELKSIIDAYSNEADDAKLVQIKDNIMQVAFKHDYAYEENFMIKTVGGMPTNRDGEGLLWHRAHTRISKIKASGFSLPAIQENAYAAEDNPFTRAYAKYTAALSKSNKHYASYKEHEIKIGCLGATHATHGMACVIDDVPCTIPNISRDGKMNKELVFDRDAAFQKAVEGGIRFRVLRWIILEVFPIIAKLIQRALNTVMQVGEGESWVQNLLNILDEAKSYNGKNVNWLKVKKTVLQSQPPRMEDIPDMVDFVQKWGGMPSGIFVDDLAECCKQYMPSSRIVSGSFFKTLTDLKVSIDAMPSHFVNAVLLVHCIGNDTQDGFARYIKKAEVQLIVSHKKHAEVMAADGVLKRCRQLLQDQDRLHDPNSILASKNLKVAIVDKVLNKVKDDRTLDDIAKVFVEMICGLDAAKADAETNEDTEVTNVVQYDEEGSASGIVRATFLNKGFKIGMCVILKKPDKFQQWKVQDVTDDGVVELATINIDGIVQVSDISRCTLFEFEDRFKESKQVEYVEAFPKNDIKNNSELNNMFHRSLAITAMYQLAQKLKEDSYDCKIMMKPLRGVYASRDYEAGKFMVPPTTFSVSAESDSTKQCPRSSVEVSFDMANSPRVFLNPTTSSEKAANPFWAIRDSSEKKECNCEFTEYIIKIKMPTITSNFGTTQEVKLQIITSTKAIKTGSEVVVFKPAAPTKVGKIKSSILAVLAPNKKAKKE